MIIGKSFFQLHRLRRWRTSLETEICVCIGGNKVSHLTQVMRPRMFQRIASLFHYRRDCPELSGEATTSTAMKMSQLSSLRPDEDCPVLYKTVYVHEGINAALLNESDEIFIIYCSCNSQHTCRHNLSYVPSSTIVIWWLVCTSSIGMTS